MRLWDADEWSVYCKLKDHEKVKEALEGRGFKVGGFVNGQPQLSEQGDWQEIQDIVADCLAGKVVLKSPQKTKEPPAVKKEVPEVKPATKKPAGAKK